MASAEWKRRWSALEYWFRDYTLLLSSLGLILGIILLIVGSISLWFLPSIPADWQYSLSDLSVRHYDLCLAPLGLVLVIFAGYYLADFIMSERKFYRLFNTVSKEKFIRNRDAIEELAFNLSTKHELMVRRKLKELKIK